MLMQPFKIGVTFTGFVRGWEGCEEVGYERFCEETCFYFLWTIYVCVLDKLMLTRRLILLLQDANLEGILRLIRSMFLHCGSALRLV